MSNTLYGYDYTIENAEELISPQLIYYKDLFEANLDQIIKMAGGTDRLWPHVKTHKSLDMTKLQVSKGIKRFKCAQLAEVEMVCMAGAESAVLAMAPTGKVPERMYAMQQAYPATQIFGIIDCEYHLEMYQKAAAKLDTTFSLLLDINMGMDRTGIPTADAGAFYKKAAGADGVKMYGFHCYDGNRHESDPGERQDFVDRDDGKVLELREHLQKEGFAVPYVIFGGSPSFPCHLKHTGEGIYYSLGTSFINDIGYCRGFPDMAMLPAAAVLCHVISHPAQGVFTLDLGYKGIAGDPPMEKRGTIIGVDHCTAIMQNEEHYVFRMDSGYEDARPAVGSALYVIPFHVCPCAVLYPEIKIASGGRIVDTWPVTARDRRINY